MGKSLQTNIIGRKRGIRMHNHIDNLSKNLRLTQYQSDLLKNNTHKYNIGRIVKRGGIVYVPYTPHGLFAWIAKFIFGAHADLIAPHKTLIKKQRNIKFCKNGYHCVKLGAYTYYGDAAGQAISRNEFLKNTQD